MTATVTTGAATRAHGGGALAGTGTLLRFALRRDRVRVPAWLAALGLLNLFSAQSFQQNYPTPQDRQVVAETLHTPAGLAMTGPRRYLEGAEYTLGAMHSHEMVAYLALAVGLLNILLVVRHTRQEEETGRAELVRASIVGRHAHLAAALMVALIANVGVAAVLAASLVVTGMPSVTVSGSVLFGTAIGALGWCFAALAAVTVQFTEHSRAATGMALAGVGVAFALRAVGDVSAEALSWVSPIGWAQRTYPFVADQWWPTLLAVAAAGLLAAVAFVLSTRRDVGAGLRPPRVGRATGSRFLTTPFGFALRLHRGLLVGFAAGAMLLAAMYGAILGEVERMVAEVSGLGELIAQVGGDTILDSFISMIMIVVTSLTAVYVVLATLRPRAEENVARAEPVLATALSRGRWMASHLATALLGGLVIQMLSGLAFAALGAASVGDTDVLWRSLGAAAAYLPALWVMCGVTTALYGWAPRLAPLAWLVPAYAFIVGYLGELLRFPGWMSHFSPLGHVPRLPAAEFEPLPLIVLTVVAAVLLVVGLAGLRRRDLAAV